MIAIIVFRFEETEIDLIIELLPVPFGHFSLSLKIIDLFNLLQFSALI